MSTPCLLFVDDEEGLLELYRSAFGREGYQIETVPTLDEARARLAKGGIDVLVLDIRLGEASGLALLREVKAADAHLPVILCTAYARYQDDFTSWLADAYVVKSSDLTPLKSAVKHCLEGRR